MGFVKTIFGFLFSRLLWTLIGITLLCLVIWFYGALLQFGTAVPLASPIARIILIGLIVIAWLVSMLLRQLRMARANRMFVTELAGPSEPEPAAPGEENIAEVQEKFQNVLSQVKRSKLGGRKFVRDMPWYVIIGPPGTGKTTALKQSGLHFPLDLTDDLKGIGGTRNCDWFFTEDVVLIDTAGRYVEQKSDPDVDSTEWFGFLNVLKKHRGRRALNGVILTLSVQELTESEAELREHGRQIRKRLGELRDELGIDLPVYLLITKADLIVGFEAFFNDLSTREREQVWGATLPVGARVHGDTVEQEMKALLSALEHRTTNRVADDIPVADRAAAFRFPAQLDALTRPLKQLIETVFGESRFDDAGNLRGFYFTSATQEGSPVDVLVGGIAANFGLPQPTISARHMGEKRSFFLRNLLTDLIFPEAGLGTFDVKSEERRRWIWRGTLATACVATLIASGVFLASFIQQSRAITAYGETLTGLSARLSNVASRQAPTDPLDMPLALDAMGELSRASAGAPAGFLAKIGPTAMAERAYAQNIAYDRGLDHILRPRMVALLEATMWRQIRDPEYLLGALKTYQMMTGLAPFDAEFVTGWWQDQLPLFAPLDPFPDNEARDHQIAAIDVMALSTDWPAPDPALVTAALDSVCSIPISLRAYRALLSDPAVAGLSDWTPAAHVGPNGAEIFTRLSDKTLRVGLPGAFTYAGFHETVAPRIGAVAVQAAVDRTVFAGGCPESADASTDSIEADIAKLYYDDFIAQWDSLLRDLRIAPIEDLQTASRNLRDLSSADSSLQRLLTAVVAETDLSRPSDAEAATDAATETMLAAAQRRLAGLTKLGKTTGLTSQLGGDEVAALLSGARVADHFKPLRATIAEVDGQPPLLTDTTAALVALSNELQVVSASPNPQAALLSSGGLPVLTGAIANEAAILPDPIDDWITGIAGDTTAVTRDAIVAQLNAKWRSDVLPFCTSATQGRYPFDQSSRIDVNILDFSRLFGAGGLIDSFIENSLAQYVDTNTRPWTWRADFGLSPEALAPFENARAIRNALFPGGAGPVIGFILVPEDLSPNASRVTLNVDGQTLSYFHANAAAQPMTWPGPNGTNMISLSFTPLEGGAEAIRTVTGAWAILRLIGEGQLNATALPEVFNLRLAGGGYSASFQLQANSVVNPFDLQIFSGFRCTEGF
ncbi:MAG: type VI secretion system membrane subunit TssM [Pseudomonadota bacterium]